MASLFTISSAVQALRSCLLRGSDPDSLAIDSAIAQMSATQEEMQKIVISQMLEFKSMLNKEQQGRFLDSIEDAMDRVKGTEWP